MRLADIFLLAGLSLLLRLAPARPRRWLVFAASVVCLYWLQPGLPIRYLGFWLPTATLFLAALGWLLTRQPGEGAEADPSPSLSARADVAAGALLFLLPLLVGLTRYSGTGDWLFESPPPPLVTLLAGLGIAAGLLLGLRLITPRLLRKRDAAGWACGLAVLLVIALLVVLKTPALALESAKALRLLSGQNPALAGVVDVRWLGFSYIAFRLIHTLRDRQAGRLPETGLRDYLTYVVFFPSLAAGPIDRLERFEKDWELSSPSPKSAGATGVGWWGRLKSRLQLQSPPSWTLPPQERGSKDEEREEYLHSSSVSTPRRWGFADVDAVSTAGSSRKGESAFSASMIGGEAVSTAVPGRNVDSAFSADLTEAGQRLVIGLLKKFAVADTLGLVALNAGNALQVNGAGWMWLLLYMYALQIFFDFSGYTDIAIAAGRLLGVKLPENFNAPYLKPNLTQFWNAWHMSLTQWFRAYFFNPFVRWLRGRRVKLSAVEVLLATQVATFVLIGLWHGITLNFMLWGLWHGLGLFFQNRWTEATRGWFAARNFSPLARRALAVFSTLLTFHYVALGWVFFVLPTPGMAVEVFKTLFGG